MCEAAQAEGLAAAPELDLDVLTAICSRKLFGGRGAATHSMAESMSNSADLLEDFLRCMVCFESFKSPKVLQCQHTFCEHCLTNWNGKGGGTAKGISCPTCRIRTPLSGDLGISSLPSDFKVTKLCELLQQVLVRSEESESRACDICAAGGDRKVASHFCAQCSESFCPTCCDLHSSNKLFTNHHVVDLSTQASSGKLFCKQHGSKPIKYICMECNIFICTVCAINVHNGEEHNVQDMEYGLKAHVDKLKTLSEKIDLKLKDVQHYHEQLCEVQILLKGLHDNLEEKIDERVTNHIDKTSVCQNQLKEALATPTFGSEYRGITWAIEVIKESAHTAITQQTDVVTQTMKEARSNLTDDLKTKHRLTNVAVSQRIDSIAFHMASIESLASFLGHLMVTLNPLEIITIYDDLIARVDSILDTEPEGLASHTFTVFSFDPDGGEYELGVLVEEEVTVSEFIDRMRSEDDEEEEETEEEIIEIEDLETQHQSEEDAILALDAMLDEEGAVGGMDLTPTSETRPIHVQVPQDTPTTDPQNGAAAGGSPGSTISSNASVHSAPGVTMRATSTATEDKSRRHSLPVMAGINQPHSGRMRPSSTAHFANLSANNHLPPPQEGEALPSYEESPTSPGENTSSTDAASPSTSAIGRSLSAPEANGTSSPQKTTPPLSETPKEYFFEAQPLSLLWEKVGSVKAGSMSSYKKPQSVSKRSRSSSGSNLPGSGASPDLRYPTDIAFLRNGSVIVADAVDRNLQIFSTDTMMWSKVKDRRQPFVSVKPIAWNQIEPVCVVPTPTQFLDAAAVTSINGEYVTITDAKDKCIKMIDIQSKGSCVATWGKSWFNPMFKQPSGVTVTRFGKYIVTDIGRHSVSMHDPDGRCILQFGSRGKGAYGFEQPRYVAVDQHDRILVSDSGNGGVKVYDTNGQFLLKIGSRDSLLTCPMGVCTDPHGHIVIADKHRHCVNLFNTDGRLVKQVVTSKDNLRYPTSVAVSDHGQLAVAMLEPAAVKFFQICP